MFIKQLLHDLNFGKYLYLGMAATMILMGIVYTPPEPWDDFFYFPWWIFPVILIGIVCIIQVGRFFNKAFCKQTGYLVSLIDVTKRELFVSKIVTAMLWFNFMRGVYLTALAGWSHQSIVLFLNINAKTFFFISALFLFITVFRVTYSIGKVPRIWLVSMVAIVGWLWLYFWINNLFLGLDGFFLSIFFPLSLSSFFINIVFGIITALATYYLLTERTVYVNSKNNSI